MDIYNRTELARTKAHEPMYSIDNDVSRSCLPLHSCRSLLVDIKDMFNMEYAALSTDARVQAWRKELTDIEKKLIFPKTVIAVVGETGAGKSSLLNALLDCSVLPTSGIRACTAAVVEVVQNTDSSFFEADIEFLQTKEWFDELEVLLKDLTALDGTIKKGVLNPDSDAYASYCKVLAVYGRVEPLPVLTRITTVTHWLGKVNVLKSDNAEDFRRQVETFIETQDPGSGGQYWPIVKHVRLRLPHCDVCSSGAALVDLPGVRDSNAARDRIAKEYLKNCCTAVWVVNSIPRAIDRKMANDLLGESFHRQLVMDGQSGSIAFICTKTDILNSSEIIRSLKLDKETKELKTEIKALETEKADLDLSVANRNLEHKRLQGTIKELETDVIESQQQEAIQKGQ
ncbi:nuclear GTPase SLIP-GC-like [Dreissena polymorpha]|uniref:nuclear GTPase SLIP-GC-like n=1 Tax=Dreissena polymorpha TaxID=45954 RepID=UPI0022654F5D|nr:nuclear GTPase SLIP-GC-like [Dreissena polymorpha]